MGKIITLLRCEPIDRANAIARFGFGDYDIWSAANSDTGGGAFQEIVAPIEKACIEDGNYVWVDFLSALDALYSIDRWGFTKACAKLAQMVTSSDASVVIAQTDALPIQKEIAQLLNEVLVPYPTTAEIRAAMATVAITPTPQLLRLAAGVSHSDLAICLPQAVKSENPASFIESYRARKLASLGIDYFPPPSFQKIAGLDLLQQALPMLEYRLGEEAEGVGLPAPRGWLFAGIPGTGKTYSARVISAFLGLPMFAISLDAVQAGGTAILERMLRLVEASAPSILFLDEIEKLFRVSTNGAILAIFLKWLNDKTAKVFVIGTLNRLDDMPIEMTRAGRFDKVWQIDSPDDETRVLLCKLFMSKFDSRFGGINNVFDDYQWRSFADATLEFVGAEIEQLVYDVVARVKSKNRDGLVSIEDLVAEAINFKTMYDRSPEHVIGIRNRLEEVADQSNSGDYGILRKRELTIYSSPDSQVN